MIAPMLATLAEAPLIEPSLVYEPKYDRIRAIAEVGAGGHSVRLWSRLGNDKTSQFPEVAQALALWGKRRREPVTIDGEIVALDAEGRPAGFQQLQGRIHVKGQHGTFGPTAFILFDVLRVGERDLRDQALTVRRASLESLFARSRSPLLRVSEDDALVYAGHVGTGCDKKALARVTERMKPLQTRTCPFAVKPASNERPHWVRPELVVQITFAEWAEDHHLRHPVFIGLRDDASARAAVRERATRLHGSATRRLRGTTDVVSGFSRTNVASGFSRTKSQNADITSLVDRLRALEDARRDGVLQLPGGDTLSVTNLHKVFWPQLGLTKGDLFRYYAQVSRYILPVVADRPLVMKRFPNGIEGKAFYQHRAEHPPAGVRVETVEAAEGVPQLIGGTLKTLRYSCQLASISQDPWFSRMPETGTPDQIALDLDPSDGVPFEQVLDVARWIRDELRTLGIFALPKTSGATGMHIFIPLAPGTPYEAGLIFCQLVATLLSEKHPRVATIERSVKARGPRVYVDDLPNSGGKTLASAYSARASEYAGVSTPLTWKEVDRGVRREDFTIVTVPARLKKVGDLWEGIRTAPGADLRAVADGS